MNASGTLFRNPDIELYEAGGELRVLCHYLLREG